MKTKKAQAIENIKEAKKLLAKAELELEEVDKPKFPQEGEYFLDSNSVYLGRTSKLSAVAFRDFNKRKVAEISRIENMIQRALRQTADELCPDFVADVSDDSLIYFIDNGAGGLEVDWYTGYIALGTVGFDTEGNAEIAIERVAPMHEELQKLWGLG